tara:strand:- start:324 stop:542 length:219 start_codon:yes stop_codon:yes gene_type:complete
MILTARINRNAIEIFDATTGGIHRTHSLPPGTYSGLVIGSDTVTVTIHTAYSGDKIRTINMQTGGMISDISM